MSWAFICVQLAVGVVLAIMAYSMVLLAIREFQVDDYAGGAFLAVCAAGLASLTLGTASVLFSEGRKRQ